MKPSEALEKLILVTVDDKEIGSLGKEEVHREGLLHRAFSVFLYDGERMLLQKRADGKYHSGGLWTNACCSHPRVGEALEDAVHRRLMLECGLDQVPEPIGSEDVGRCGDGLPVVTFDVLDDGVGTLIARSVVDDDLGAFACQR